MNLNAKFKILETNEMKTAHYNWQREAYLKEGGKIWNEKVNVVLKEQEINLNIVKKKKKKKQTLK